MRAADWLPPALNPLPYAGLISSLPDEHDYECRVDGQLPELSGTLYRIGPGLYDFWQQAYSNLSVEAMNLRGKTPRSPAASAIRRTARASSSVTPTCAAGSTQ